MKHQFSLIPALVTGITCASIAVPAYAKAPNPQISSAICSTNNISLGSISATACEGPISGNDTGAQGTLLDKLNNNLFSSSIGTGVQWSLAGKSDDTNPFAITAGSNSTGTWGLGAPLSSNTFVVSLKSSNAYSAYLFKDYDFSQGLTGIFNTIGVALNGSGTAGKDLSHASLFVSNIAPPHASVPEPASLVALGLVATGIATVRRRRAI
ncbi:PEP-CTERM sorting domain-containing protein [Calothrix sp. PCC 6303]|uniref:PEP-CTERM sorting domain-containing protein n=1 Tax=Calothrix sp. PCC 6303 TaxID=1170562 RepID=UPI0002A05978|nr:PEP-CTERM sorting domain-containing protein [Calothrix sp. PCC 6303]AFY99586.1 PEP motif putative anchor domain protein [Calothrix sp. PCC 6303]